MKRHVRIVLAAAVLAAPLPLAAQEFAAKTVTLVVGFAPGGGYDAAARVLARTYGRYLPGNPTIIVQNQPGAGSMVAANSLYNTAPKDGSQLGMFAAAVALEPLLGNASAKYDVTRFEWIGNLNRDTSSCGAWQSAGVKSWREASKKKLAIAVTGIGAIQQGRFMVSELGAPFNLIYGFSGMGAIHLAMQRGEIDGGCGIFTSTARNLFRADIESGRLNIFLQFSEEPEPYFGGAATVYSLMRTADDRRLAALIFLPAEISRPIAAPPGTPPGTVRLLRAALEKAVQDPEYLAEMRKMDVEPRPLTGEQTTAAFAGLLDAPKALIERARGIITPPQKSK